MNALAAASRSDVSSVSVRMVDTVGSSRQAMLYPADEERVQEVKE